jgi:hypothetical protein
MESGEANIGGLSPNIGLASCRTPNCQVATIGVETRPIPGGHRSCFVVRRRRRRVEPPTDRRAYHRFRTRNPAPRAAFKCFLASPAVTGIRSLDAHRCPMVSRAMCPMCAQRGRVRGWRGCGGRAAGQPHRQSHPCRSRRRPPRRRRAWLKRLSPISALGNASPSGG